MNGNGQDRDWLNLRNLAIAGAALLLVLVIAVLWLVLRPAAQSQLMPVLPTPTNATRAAQEDAQAVTFDELNADPLAYLNRTVLVTGDFLLVAQPDCARVSGPDVRWSLTADNLQLDALGLERIVGIVPEGTDMTVQGIWRLYQGPLGCGKAPPQGTRWYLDARRVVQPNPLVGAGGQPIAIEIRSGDMTLPALVPTAEAMESEPFATQIPGPTEGADTIVATATLADQIIPTQTPIPTGVTEPTVTAAIEPTAASSANTPVSNGTAAPTTTPTATPTADPNAGTPTITAEAPPIVTEPPGGYPGQPTSTPTFTPSPDPYP